MVRLIDYLPAVSQHGRVKDPALVRLLEEAARGVERDTAAALSDRGVGELSPGRATALVLVDRGGTRLTELAVRASISKQAMMQVVDELERLGCVRRVRDPKDARAKVVKLTAKGVRYRAEAGRAVTSAETRAKRRLGEQRYERLRGSLQELAATAE